jgi:2-oxoisovalerate dehydrogenase E1 component
MPDEMYTVPIGKGRITLQAHEDHMASGTALCIVTYGMGVHWALYAAKSYDGQITIVDLRSLVPLDEQLVYETVNAHGRCLVITEEALSNSFAQSVAARIQENCWSHLDAPVKTIGAVDMPAVPLNETLEKEMILSGDKVQEVVKEMLAY